MRAQSVNAESEAFQHYLQIQRSFIDDHDMGLRAKTLDASFMSGITELLENDVTKEDATQEIRRMLAAATAQKKSVDNVPESGCGELMTYVARTLLMVKVGSLVSEPNNPRKYVTWNSGVLRDCIATYFNEDPKISIDGFRLPKTFDAWRIERLAGIRISFTDNLADHLRLEEEDDEGDSEVLIFHHAAFLKSQGEDSLLPTGLADETLRTLALLFPPRQFSKTNAIHKKKRGWFERCCRNARTEYGQIVDQQVIKCKTLPASERQIDHFHFWRDRLVILKQAYDEATPRALPQWWYDRRNGPQWYTFWTAIVVLVLTVFFGLIQSIEGAIQVYKAYHPS